MPLVTATTASSTGSTLYTGAGRVWRSWNDTSTTASTASTTADVWDAWSITSSATGSNTDVWLQWVSGSVTGTTATTSSTVAWSSWVQGVETGAHHSRRPRIEMGMTAAQRQALAEADEASRARQAAWDEERAKERARQAEADERAMALLQSLLTDEQREDLATHGYFYVKAKSGRLYRIGKGRAGNVKVVDPVTKVWQETLCVHQRERVPYGDTMAMQKLLIETAEDVFRSYANISDRNGRYTNTAKSGLLKGDELYNVLMFPGASEEDARAEAAA